MLRFQSAGAAGGYLLEHLLHESIGARRGGGVFAWANSSGVKSLLEDEVFDEFLVNGNFRLLVGTDSITDPPAVERLMELSTRRPGLEVRAFMSPTTLLFHPKLAWFEHQSRLSLIVGSGNLTMGGLRSNWEAFVVLGLTGEERAKAMGDIEDFLATVGEHVLPIDDPRVLQRAQQNSGNERALRVTSSSRAPALDASTSADAVLVAEIPRSGDRPSQANFDQRTYEDFFGARVGSQRRITLHHVDSTGTLGEVESRPSVEVTSKNYRFELAAARGITYPTAGPPIGIFLRLGTGQFLYSLLLPGEPGYTEVGALLAALWHGRSDRKRRVQVTLEQIRLAWPTSQLWHVELPEL